MFGRDEDKAVAVECVTHRSPSRDAPTDISEHLLERGPGTDLGDEDGLIESQRTISVGRTLSPQGVLVCLCHAVCSGVIDAICSPARSSARSSS